MKVVLSGRGSRGDIYPIIAVSEALQKAGHTVEVAIPTVFGDEARNHGLDPYLYPEDSREMMKNLGSGMQSSKGALAFLTGSIHQQFDFLMEACRDADVLITHTSEMSAPTVAAYHNIPHYRLAYAPILPGRYPPPLFPLQNMPAFLNSLSWKSLQMISLYLLRRLLNDKRKSLGLPPVTSSVKYYTDHSTALLAYNSTLAPPCPQWKKKGFRYYFTGYCFNHEYGALDPALQRFIEAGTPPVYAGFGSVHLKDPKKFTGILEEAAAATGTRIVLATGWMGLMHTSPTENIFLTGETYHGTLFSKMAGVIHHGGSGTTHTATKAGTPQFILPQLVDQYYWGNRVWKTGLGPKPLPPRRITVKYMKHVLETFKAGAYKGSALKMADKMKKENGVQKIVEIITTN